MLDVRPTAYIVPLAEQVLDDITPVVQVTSAGDEAAQVTGLIRIYRQSTDQLLYNSELAVTIVPGHTTVNIAALSAWSPPAPADDDYFILCDTMAISVAEPTDPDTMRASLGAWHFDIKPGPMGPAPAAHHATHENGGMDEVSVAGLSGLLADEQDPLDHAADHQLGGGDEIDVTGLSGALADPQTPAAHYASHEDGGSDEIDVTGLSGVLADDQPALAHDIAGGRHTSAATPGQILAANASGLPVDATNTDAEVAAVVTDAERTPNKGIAGGYCGLPNPLDSTQPLRADGTPAQPAGVHEHLEFLSNSYHPWQGAAVSGGTLVLAVGQPNHPGIKETKSSTNVNSGYYFLLTTNALLLAGSEACQAYIRPITLAGTTIRIGFHNTGSSAAPTDGAYIEIAHVGATDGVALGKTANNANYSSTGTNYTLITNTWYRLLIVLNADATRVNFYIYSEAGALLWTDSLTTNIPTAPGHETGNGIIATNSLTISMPLLDVDYISLDINRALVR